MLNFSLKSLEKNNVEIFGLEIFRRNVKFYNDFSAIFVREISRLHTPICEFGNIPKPNFPFVYYSGSPDHFHDCEPGSCGVHFPLPKPAYEKEPLGKSFFAPLKVDFEC
jgi:hypothetical protein